MNDKTVLTWDEVFDKPFGSHGLMKASFDSDDVTIEYNSGGQLLEVADFSDGSSAHGATLGDDRNIEVIAPNGRILGVLEYRNGSQPTLKVNGKTVTGGASRFTSFVSETGAADEDPKPQMVADATNPEQYEVNRETGHAAWGNYRVRVYYIEPGDHTNLTLQASGHTPKTNTVFPEPEASAGYCGHCGVAL